MDKVKITTLDGKEYTLPCLLRFIDLLYSFLQQNTNRISLITSIFIFGKLYDLFIFLLIIQELHCSGADIYILVNIDTDLFIWY